MLEVENFNENLFGVNLFGDPLTPKPSGPVAAGRCGPKRRVLVLAGMDKLPLTRAEVAAVIEYVFLHVRATDGKAKRVYDKTHDFLNHRRPVQGAFKFGVKKRREAIKS